MTLLEKASQCAVRGLHAADLFTISVLQMESLVSFLREVMCLCKEATDFLWNFSL